MNNNEGGPADETDWETDKSITGVDKRKDIELRHGTSAKNYTTVSVIRSPTKLAARILTQCFHWTRLEAIAKAAGEGLKPYVKEALQYVARMIYLAKNTGPNQVSMPQSLSNSLPDTENSSIRRVKYGNITPVLPSGDQVKFFAEYFEIRYLDEMGTTQTLDDATKKIWDYHRSYEEFVKALGEKNPKKKPASSDQMKRALDAYRRAVNDSRLPPTTKTQAQQGGTNKRNSEAAGLGNVPQENSSVAVADSAPWQFWAAQRDSLAAAIEVARAKMNAQFLSPDMRTTGQHEFAHLTIELENHMKLEPNSSGSVAATAPTNSPPGRNQAGPYGLPTPRTLYQGQGMYSAFTAAPATPATPPAPQKDPSPQDELKGILDNLK